MKLDILAIGAHPDDVELACAGTLLKHVSLGKKVGILDLTAGELGTRGSAEIRANEAKASAKILGLSARENLGYKDGFFQNDEAHQRGIIQVLRKYQPDVVLANAIHDRHPDHGRAAELISQSCFYSGLIKIKTEDDGVDQGPWRPNAVYHYIQDRYITPDFVVDITDFAEQKMEAIMAFSSQFYNPDSAEPESPISSPEFLETIRGRMSDFGRIIQARYGEGFTVERSVGIEDITAFR